MPVSSALGPVDIWQHYKISTFLQGSTQRPSVLKIIKRNLAIALETQVQKIEVLGDYRGRATRKSQRESKFSRAEVVELEDKIFGQMCLVAPDDPSNSNVSHTKFMTTRRYGEWFIAQIDLTTHEALIETTRGILKSQSRSD